MAIPLMAISMGISAIMSIAKAKQARAQERRAQNFVDNFEPHPMSNKYSDLQISTHGAEMRNEAALADFTSITESFRGGGMRDIMGGLTRAQSRKDLQFEKSAAELDSKQKELDLLGAGDEVRMEGIYEKRKTDELLGYGNLLDVARGDKNQANADMMTSIMGILGGLGGEEGEDSGAGDVFGGMSGGAGTGGTGFGTEAISLFPKTDSGFGSLGNG